jgi:peroxiredoxin
MTAGRLPTVRVAMLKENQIAPDFTLPKFGGGDSAFYQDAPSRMSVLVFYKFSCPTCQYTLPWIQKIYDAYGDAFHFVLIAQDGPEKTAEFRKEYGISIPTLMDLPPYRVSNTYKIDTVPSTFLVEPDHRIRYCFDGFARQDLLNLADVLAEKSGKPQIDLYENTDVPDFKPG